MSKPDLDARAAAAAEQVTTIERALEAAGVEEVGITTRLATALGDGATGKVIAALAAERDRAQMRVASLRQDLEVARRVAEDRAREAAGARLSEQTAALAPRLAEVATQLETLMRDVAPTWVAFDSAQLEARALRQAIAAHVRRYRLDPKDAPAEPTAGAGALTPELYGLARRVGPALRTLDLERERRAHPEPPPAPFFHTGAALPGGDSERAKRVRAGIEQGDVAPGGQRRVRR